MNAFVNAVTNQQVQAQTFNGGATLNTSSNPVVDLFNAAGNRNVDLSKQFDLAVAKDKKLALRIALWARDIRGGAGERKTFRNLLGHLERHYTDDLIALIPFIPEYGRWDDILMFTNVDVKKAAFGEIRKALVAKNGLCAKWMPRKGQLAKELREYLDLSPKAYRKQLVSLTKVVESQMCSKEWDKIVFDHVPSLASARYQKAFLRNCGQSYKDYRDGLNKIDPNTGKTVRKINAAAVYPYDVIKSIDNGDRQVAKAQWNALPNYLGEEKILPMVDVSGSMMSWSYYNQRGKKSFVPPSVSPLQIAVSIGLYTAEKQKGSFNGMFLTFSSQPKIQKLSGDIINMKTQMESAHWQMSTNIEKAFMEILAVAKKNHVPQADMPHVLLILSDMEFDACTREPSKTAYEDAREQFQDAGYELPKIVFWNINGRADNVPVSHSQTGTALVSGFSPAIFKSVLSNNYDTYTPESVMLETIMNKRYDIPGITI